MIEGVIEKKVQQVVCLNALTGHNQGENTILVGGTAKKRQLTILIYSGNTHSFIDEHTTKAAGYQPSPYPPVRVTVVDANYVMCTSHCKSFMWKMQGRSFAKDLLIIPLERCYLVLGNDWMKRHNSTKFDHERRCVTIGRKPNKLVLPALAEEGSLRMLSSGSMSRILKKGQDLIAHLFIVITLSDHTERPITAEIQEVEQHKEVFAEPKSLPPTRSLDQSIPFKPGVMPVSLRPTSKITTIRII